MVLTISFNQGPMGHECRKPTTLAVISISELQQLQDVRGKGVGPKVQQGQPQPTPRAAMTIRERIDNSKLWASWAPGLKAAIVEGLRRWLFSYVPPREYGPQQKITLRALGDLALQQWKQHYMQDHLPARRDCSRCLRAQGRSRPHKRVEHSESFTLSLDLSGKLTPQQEAPIPPLFHGNVPTRRLRQKTAPLPAISLVSMLNIEGEKMILDKNGGCFECQLPRDPEDEDVFPVPFEDSWTLETEQSPHQAPLPGDDENESGGEEHDDERASVGDS